jgi:cellulose synthase/poly-beta-1,6-N-acetylglucosamine synthase-like glycosyltransferase
VAAAGNSQLVLLPLAVGSGLAAALAGHTALNALLVRRAIPGDRPDLMPKVSVLIPARNEATRIGPTLRSVLQSDSEEVSEVLVLDDHSTDATVAVIEAVSAGDSRLQVLSGRELPEGWLGKPWACDQLGRAASGDVLVFIDADVELLPGAIRSSIALLRRHDLSLVSPYPRQQAVTVGERVVQPLLQWLWLSFLPLRFAERPKPESMAAANGQIMVFDAQAWNGIGGHGAVKADVIEDVGMARAIKRAGLRAAIADGSQVASCRMYETWSALQEGYSKSLWSALPSRPAAQAVGATLALTYVVPPLAAVAGLATSNRAMTRIGLGGYFAGVVGRVISARTTGGSVADATAHPVSVAALLWLGRRSWRLRTSGALSWKGRSLDVS